MSTISNPRRVIATWFTTCDALLLAVNARRRAAASQAAACDGPTPPPPPRKTIARGSRHGGSVRSPLPSGFRDAAPHDLTNICPRRRNAGGRIRLQTHPVITQEPNNSPAMKNGDQTIWGFMRVRNSPLQSKHFQNSHVALHQHTIIIEAKNHSY